MNSEINLPSADILVPDGRSISEALARTTHLAIGAHQDDLEFMAYHGISECYEADDKWFLGIVVTNGAGSVRTGKYHNFTDQQICEVRREEQRAAAKIGKYSAVIQLGYSSDEVRAKRDQVIADLVQIVSRAQPQSVYLHNPLDKHSTHLAVLNVCVQAMRGCLSTLQPCAVYGCEVWRGLDWLNDNEKILLDVSHYPELATKLHAAFDSQTGSGKHYDLAIQGRWSANATFSQPRQIDAAARIAFAIDLMPLFKDPTISLTNFALAAIERFKAQVKSQLT